MAELPRDLKSVNANLERVIREFSYDHDSPLSLRIQSGVTGALVPIRAAVEQVIDAMVARLRGGSSPSADTAVAAAIAHWQKVCGSTATTRDVASFVADATQAEARDRRKPPPIDSIVSGLAERTDVGFDMGIPLEGLKGAWHRLWGMVVLCVCMGGVADDGARTVRKQMEQLLNRELSLPE